MSVIHCLSPKGLDGKQHSLCKVPSVIKSITSRWSMNISLTSSCVPHSKSSEYSSQNCKFPRCKIQFRFITSVIKRQCYREYKCIGNVFLQISELEEKIIQYALKVAEHEKSALMNIKEQQNLKKELEECQLYKAKYERLVISCIL